MNYRIIPSERVGRRGPRWGGGVGGGLDGVVSRKVIGVSLEITLNTQNIPGK